MNITIPFAELSEYLRKYYGKTVSFSPMDHRQIKVVYRQSLLVANVNVPLIVNVEEVIGDTLVLSYEGKFGIEKLITCIISYIRRRHPEMSEMIGMDKEAPGFVDINFSKIKQMQGLLNVVELTKVNVLKEGLEFVLNLRSED